MEAFVDQNFTIRDFASEVLVACPHCAAKALILAKPAGISLSCIKCGLAKTRDPQVSALFGAAVDPYFRLDLFLKADCCGETLFAYNQRHLQYLREFVEAEIRQRAKNPTSAIRNATLASRLPHWLKLAKNRDEIMKKIADLEAKLAAAG